MMIKGVVASKVFHPHQHSLAQGFLLKVVLEEVQDHCKQTMIRSLFF
jgi:hypothetical protein